MNSHRKGFCQPEKRKRGIQQFHCFVGVKGKTGIDEKRMGEIKSGERNETLVTDEFGGGFEGMRDLDSPPSKAPQMHLDWNGK